MSSKDLDRRAFLARAATAGAVAWVTPVLLSSPAAAAGSCLAAPGAIDWSTFASGAPGPSIANYPWVVGTFSGTTVTFDFGGATQWLQFAASGVNRTCVQSGTTGGITGYFRSDRDKAANPPATFIPDGPGAASVLTMTFSQPVCNLRFTILDCDQNLTTTSAAEWTDQVVIEPFDGGDPVSGSYTPAATLSPNLPQVGTGVTFTGNSTTNVADTSPSANIACTIAGPVDEVRISHIMAMPLTDASQGDRQHIGISDISWG